MKKKILFILPTTGQPRYAKRIDSLKKLGFYVEALSFKRKYHQGRMPDCKISFLSYIKSENYFLRFLTLIKDLPKIKKKSDEFDLVYAFGADMGYLSILSFLVSSKPVVCEIADIMPIQQKSSFWGILIRFLDKLFLKKVKLLVFTSKHYAYYFKEYLNFEPHFITLENKIDNISFKPLTKNFDDAITIGYFGLIRCAKSIEILNNLVKRYPYKFKVLIAGFNDHTVNLEKISKNIEYIGEYKSPQDLPKIYGQVDIVWNVHFEFKYTKWAISNRFYESLYFQKPYIVNEGSLNVISNKDCGLKISIKDDFNKIIDSISKIHPQDIKRWTNNVKQVDSSVYQYTKKDYTKLNDEILKLL